MTSNLERIVAHCKSSVHVTVNGHMVNSETIAEYIYRINLDGEYIDKHLALRMIAYDCICEVQAYPRTPIGSYSTYADTLDEAIGSMMDVLEISGPSNPSSGKLQRIAGNVKSCMRIDINEHTVGYQSITDYLSDERTPCDPKGVSKETIGKCVKSGSIWEVGRTVSSTMDEALYVMLEVLGLEKTDD